MKKVRFTTTDNTYELASEPTLSSEGVQLTFNGTNNLKSIYNNAIQETCIEIYDDTQLTRIFNKLEFFTLTVIKQTISLEFRTSEIKDIITGMQDSDKKEKEEINKQINTLENLVEKVQNIINDLTASQEMQDEAIDSLLNISDEFEA